MELKLPFLDLLNSDWHDWRGSGRTEDRLDRADWLGGFLSRWGLDPGTAPGRAERSALKELRSLLRRLVEKVRCGVRLSAAELAELNGVLERTSVVRRLVVADGGGQAAGANGYRLETTPTVRNWDWVRAEIALSFVDVLARGDPTRLKICDNPACGWVFYDRSKGRSRRWCDSQACGNLLKVRRFRAKKKGNP